MLWWHNYYVPACFAFHFAHFLRRQSPMERNYIRHHDGHCVPGLRSSQTIQLPVHHETILFRAPEACWSTREGRNSMAEATTKMRWLNDLLESSVTIVFTRCDTSRLGTAHVGAFRMKLGFISCQVLLSVLSHHRRKFIAQVYWVSSRALGLLSFIASVGANEIQLDMETSLINLSVELRHRTPCPTSVCMCIDQLEEKKQRESRKIRKHSFAHGSSQKHIAR